jgi:hypothetical protein
MTRMLQSAFSYEELTRSAGRPERGLSAPWAQVQALFMGARGKLLDLQERASFSGLPRDICTPEHLFRSHRYKYMASYPQRPSPTTGVQFASMMAVKSLRCINL